MTRTTERPVYHRHEFNEDEGPWKCPCGNTTAFWGVDSRAWLGRDSGGCCIECGDGDSCDCVGTLSQPLEIIWDQDGSFEIDYGV